MQSLRQVTIVNPQNRFRKVTLTEPTHHAYLLLAAEVDHTVLPFFLMTSSKKKKLLKQCKTTCQQLDQLPGVLSAVLFKSWIRPPGRGKFIAQRKDKVHVARFDVVVLIEAQNREILRNIQSHPAYLAMEQAMKSAAAHTYITLASNVKRIRDVDHQREGVFLFNFFFADDAEQNLGVWEYTAGWFQQETGLDNSTVLLPVENDHPPYTLINHCRWDRLSDVLPSLLFKGSFRSFVLAHFFANRVAAMPILYKMV